jgi:WhiB family redox-sensing transcriptional regulator
MSLDALVRLPAWRCYAACRTVGPSLFFAPDGASQAIAQAVCAGCDVREDCAAEAAVEELDQPFVFGVRGGLTASERRTALANSDRPPDGPHEFAGRLRVSWQPR